LSVGALALAPASALAQDVPAATANTPATDSIGPKALQNFSLNGKVTHAAEQPVAVPPASQKPAPNGQATVHPPAVEPSSLADATSTQSNTAAPAPSQTRTETALASQPQQQARRTPEPQAPPPSSPSTDAPLPGLSASITPSSAAPVAQPGTFAPAPATPGTLAPEHGFSFLPWLLALLALAIGGGFLFWRNRGRPAFASARGPQIDAFTAPAPAPPSPPVRAPQPASAPRPAPAPQPQPPSGAPSGLVSTRLRPWIDIGFHPLRCVLENEQVTVEFEMELFNSGSAPARAVLVEASLFNAGPTQDQEIGGFFTNPVGEGERIVAIQPLKRIAINTKVVVPRTQVRAYELGGREAFVPLLAFNALYSWGGGDAQTSAAYLLGRGTEGEKMAPFRLDLGPRIFRGLGARLLPVGVRR
jgi:hypothetical protein